MVTQEVGLFWADGEIVLPMANAFVSIVQKLGKSGDIRRRLEGDHQIVADSTSGRRKRLEHA